MRRALIAAGFVGALASLLIAGGRGNFVTHYDSRSGTFDPPRLMSQGACRHHLTAHPLDTVATLDGEVHSAGACN